MQTPSGMESSCRFLDNTENSEFMHIYVIDKFTSLTLSGGVDTELSQNYYYPIVLFTEQ